MKLTVPSSFKGCGFFCIPLVFFFLTGCQTVQLGSRRQVDVKEVTEIAITRQFNDKYISTTAQDSITQSLRNAIASFNAGRRTAFKLVYAGEQTASQYSCHVVFSDPKIPSRGAVTASYFVTLVGMIGVPYVMIASELPFFIFFYYVPMVQHKYTLKLSPQLGGDRTRLVKAHSEAATWFRSLTVSQHASYRRLEADLEKQFKALNRQVKARK